MKISSTSAVALCLGFILMSFTGHCYGQLQVGFYREKCLVDVEAIVTQVVAAKFNEDPTIAPALIRMQFHDCFVKGCDASILLDGNNTEKTAPPNLSVRGFEVIDAAKDAVEAVCPGVVSCADIISMATRDVFALINEGCRYDVQTGRRDGSVSLAQNVDLPSPRISVNDSIAAFARKGLSATDMVYLLGGHTVGVAHCSLFQDRLYNFQNTGKPDPTMNPWLASQLRPICPQNSTGSNTVNLDQSSQSSFISKSYYWQILMRNGILQIDQELALDPLTRSTVQGIALFSDFRSKFGQAMVKLGAVEVLTGTQGEIRKSCRAINTN
ncbi:peroxidase 60 [Quercus lobata]|uniref:Peroxidase n=1 Tax=Quercus lobata TaxID=97700 RepID=A0A7N2KLX7_QUELO|nr:peroxidase 60 [Quercus lobata]